MSELRIRKPYDPSEGKGLSCPPGRTKQSHRDECDINHIMAKYQRTGDLTHISESIPSFGDFTHVLDYKSALDQTQALEQEFSTLPAATRSEFDNDPSKLLEFLSDPKNADKAIELGLAPDPKKVTRAAEDAAHAAKNSPESNTPTEAPPAE